MLLAPSVHFCPSASVYYGKWEFIIWICSVPTLETKFPQLPVCHMCIPAYKAFVWLFSGSCCICDGGIHNGHRSNDCYSSNWTPRWQNVFRHNICSRSTQRLLRESWRCNTLIPTELPASHETCNFNFSPWNINSLSRTQRSAIKSSANLYLISHNAVEQTVPPCHLIVFAARTLLCV